MITISNDNDTLDTLATIEDATVDRRPRDAPSIDRIPRNARPDFWIALRITTREGRACVSATAGYLWEDSTQGRLILPADWTAAPLARRVPRESMEDAGNFEPIRATPSRDIQITDG